jgi:hypothetical protein
MSDPDEAGSNSGYWSVLEPYWEKIDIYRGPERFLATYGAAPEVPQVLFAARFCESEAMADFTSSSAIRLGCLLLRRRVPIVA